MIILVEDILPLDNDIIKIALHQENEYVKMIRNKILKRFYWQTVGFAILFFGTLILNELIIFNLCGREEFESTNLILINSNDDNCVLEEE